MSEQEGTSVVESVESTPVEQSSPEPVQTTQTEGKEAAPTPEKLPEPSLRERFAKKAAEVGEREAKKAKKEPVSPSAEPKTAPDPGAPKVPTGMLQTPAFAPNFKFKVMDKEHEIPAYLQSVIKDADSEKQVKELMEKAYGLDFVKPKLQETREQFQQVRGEHMALLGQVDEVRQMYQRGDLGGMFDRLKIPHEKVLQWVVDQINYNQLPPEQKQVLDARKTAEDRAVAAERQASSFQTQHEQILTSQVQMALESSLARPEVKTVAEAFDTRMGKQGAFMDEVKRRGDYAWRTKGELVPPDQLVQELVGLIGAQAPQQQPVAPAQPASAPQAPAAPQTRQAQAKPPSVIPNISGSSASALKSQMRSIDDLKNKYKEMQTSG